MRGLLRRVADIDVIPLVVFWGQDVTPPPEPFRRAGTVRIVAGKHGALWRPLLDTQRLDAEMVAQLSARVHRWLVEQEDKLIGVAVHRHPQLAQRVGRGSIAVLTVLVALYPATKVWPGRRSSPWSIPQPGRGAMGVAVLLLPLILALAALGVVHFARRLDPTISFLRGMPPLLFCGACFSLLVLVVP